MKLQPDINGELVFHDVKHSVFLRAEQHTFCRRNKVQCVEMCAFSPKVIISESFLFPPLKLPAPHYIHLIHSTLLH